MCQGRRGLIRVKEKVKQFAWGKVFLIHPQTSRRANISFQQRIDLIDMKKRLHPNLKRKYFQSKHPSRRSCVTLGNG